MRIETLVTVIDILEKRGLTSEARKLSLVSKETMICVGKHALSLSKAYPLQALEDSMSNTWKRRCISFAILKEGLARMNGAGNMKNFMNLYRGDLKGKLVLAREAHPNTKYTFHVVYRYNVNQDMLSSQKRSTHSMDDKRLQKAINDHGGEIAVHRFICLPDMWSSLAFFHRWSMAQNVSIGKEALCLMECGPSDNTTCRKWIIDIDAAYKDLKEIGLLEDESLCSEADKINLQNSVISLGSSISQFLQRVGFTRSACHFALKSRHQVLPEGYKKLSWHLTLLVLAPYPEWQQAMRYTERVGYSKEVKTLIKQKGPAGALKTDKWIAAVLADSHILANSKGQYLQTLHSEKVEAGVNATGKRFQFDGVYNHLGQREESPICELLAYAATSLSMQDPWSVIAQKQKLSLPEDQSDESQKRKNKRKYPPSEDREESKRKKTAEDQSGKKSTETYLDKWELLPEIWMRGLLEITASSYLTTMPCIKEERIMPEKIFNIINSGRGKIIFYANVVHVNVCPRYLINANSIHKHHNDSAVAICITDGGQNRLFVRCFSEKCLHLCSKSSLCKWEEYNESHYTRYQRLLLSEKRKS